MTLRDLIARHPPLAVLIRSLSGDWSTQRVLEGTPALAKRLAGARVALRVGDAGQALRALVALDGAAEAVVLLAPSVPRDQLPRMIEMAQVQAVLADDAPMLRDMGVPNAAQRLEDLLAPPGVAPASTSWVLATSGTSGEPKLVVHTLDTLKRTSRTDVRPGDRPCWGLLYEWSRFAGLQVLLQSTLSGATLVAPAIDLPLESRIDLLAQAGCTHLSATPTLWRKMVMTPGFERLGLRQISLGGEIADDRILSRLGALFPQARITHIYASTEAGVGFSVNDRRAGFPLSYLTEPPAGLALRLVDGRLQVCNPSIRPRYLGSEASFGSGDGWIDTGDNVTIQDGRVLFLGRESGIVNVGGNKVHPEEVERVLLQHPGVVAARAFARRSPITGSLVVAEVVVEPPPPDAKAFRAALQRHAQAALEPFKVPAVIQLVAQIESNAMGKVARSHS